MAGGARSLCLAPGLDVRVSIIVAGSCAQLSPILPDGSSTELPKNDQLGVVGVTAGRSAAEEAAGLDTHQGQRPCPATIARKASSGRGTRAGGSAAREMVVRGSRNVVGTERTLLAAGEGRERSSSAPRS